MGTMRGMNSLNQVRKEEWSFLKRKEEEEAVEKKAKKQKKNHYVRC